MAKYTYVCKAPISTEKVFRAPPNRNKIKPLSIKILYAYLFPGVMRAPSSITLRPLEGPSHYFILADVETSYQHCIMLIADKVSI